MGGEKRHRIASGDTGDGADRLLLRRRLADRLERSGDRFDDQGNGIAARDKARIWEPFRRLDRAVEAGISGNGIGLAVVRELVLPQGGSIAVHDAAGGGASFVVTLRESARGVAPNGQTAAPGSFQTEPPPAHSLVQ